MRLWAGSFLPVTLKLQNSCLYRPQEAISTALCGYGGLYRIVLDCEDTGLCAVVGVFLSAVVSFPSPKNDISSRFRGPCQLFAGGGWFGGGRKIA